MLWAAQFGIVNGEAREDTPWVGAYRDPGRSEEPSDLYVLVHPALPGSEEFCQELRDAIGEAFHKEKVSLTGGLLRALRSAHENLRDWNRRSLKEHRVAAGVTCLAADGGRAYLAQVSPASAAVYRDGEIAFISPEIPDADEPLGLMDEFLPQFTGVELEEGARLLLLSPHLAAALPAADLAAVLALPDEDALPDLYRKAQGQTDCAALLLSVRPDPAPAAN
jgi:hypothetical protein